jgi:hypothetical protein
VWAAASAVLANDFVLRGRAPPWLTDRLSDVGWLVLVPVLLAPLLSWTRRPRTLALLVSAAAFVALQLWPPLGRVIKPDHVADAADLVALPGLLGAVWAWRGHRHAGWPVAGALALGTLVADSWSTPPDASWPCAESADWDPAQPLQLRLDTFNPQLPTDTDAFARGLTLRDANGDVPFVLANLGSSTLALCARDGLRGDTDYTWTIGPWSYSGGNEVGFEHEALPTVRFHTRAGDGVPVDNAGDCAALADLTDDEEASCETWEPIDPDSGDTG